MNPKPAPFRIAGADIRLDSMPTNGRDLTLDVGAEDRLAAADLLGITAVEKLHVRLHAVRFKGGIRVNGRLVATTVQPSVVSLEPVVQEIAEPIDRVFLPGGEKAYAGPADAEIFVDLDGEDVPTISKATRPICPTSCWRHWRLHSIPIRRIRGKVSARWAMTATPKATCHSPASKYSRLPRTRGRAALWLPAAAARSGPGVAQ